jgi:hypothetical protein
VDLREEETPGDCMDRYRIGLLHVVATGGCCIRHYTLVVGYALPYPSLGCRGPLLVRRRPRGSWSKKSAGGRRRGEWPLRPLRETHPQHRELV